MKNSAASAARTIPLSSKLTTQKRTPLTKPNIRSALFVFFRRLLLPIGMFAGFSILCLIIYVRLEGVAWHEALFWVFHPHSIRSENVHISTKLFSIFVYFAVFFF